MSRGPIEVPRVPMQQPDAASTNKGQKRYRLPNEYDAQIANTELDYLHERVNKVVVEAQALPDLDGAETLANTIARVNALAQILRNAGLLKSN